MPEQHVTSVLTTEAMVKGLTDKRTLLALAPLKLFKSSFTPGPASVVADFDAAEADFTGYAAVALSWSAVGIDSDGQPGIISTRAFFQATADTADNEIGGAWMETAGGDLYEYWVFDQPVEMGTDLSFLSAVITARYPDADDLDIDS
jgi:hypothetical protein